MSSFVCPEFVGNVIEMLTTTDDQGKLALAIIQYGTMGKEPDLDPYLYAAFEGIRSAIDDAVL